MSADRRARARTVPLAELLGPAAIRLDASAASREDAVRLVGEVLVESGAVAPEYVDAMLERERSVSTFVGESVAFPHATFAGRGSVDRDAIAIVRFPDGVDWDGQNVRVAVGIAAVGRGHIALLSRLASVLLDPERARALREAATEDEIRALLETDADA